MASSSSRSVVGAATKAAVLLLLNEMIHVSNFFRCVRTNASVLVNYRAAECGRIACVIFINLSPSTINTLMLLGSGTTFKANTYAIPMFAKAYA